MKHYYPIVILCITLGYLILKLQFLPFPPHNDEFSHISGVRHVIDNNFSPFVEWWGYHPPLVYELAAIATSKSDPHSQLVIVRVIIVFFGLLSLLFTYLIGRDTFNPSIGLTATFLLLFHPTFQSQTGLFHLAIPFTFFFLATIRYYYLEKWLLFLFFASCLVLTKETGVILLLTVSFLDLIRTHPQPWRTTIHRQFTLNLPLILFFLWMLFNKVLLGWYLWPLHLHFLTNNGPYQQPISLWQIIRSTYFDVGTWPVTLLLIIALLTLKKSRLSVFKTSLVKYFLSLSICSILFFYFGVYLPRYLLFTFPLLFITISAIIFQLIPHVITRLLIIISILLTFTSSWFDLSNQPIPWSGEQNFRYLHIVNNHQRVVNYIDQYFPYQPLAAHYPLHTCLTHPDDGYTTINRVNLSTELEEMSLTDLLNHHGLLIISDLYPNYPEFWYQVINKPNTKLVKTIKDPGINTYIYYLE